MITMAGENGELTNKLKNSQEQCRNLEQQITKLISDYNKQPIQDKNTQQEVIQEIKPLKTEFEKKLETVKGELREKVLEGSTDDYLSARELLVNIFNEFPELNSENLLS
jgi:flagellar motility protein MotE (MotC chaperone)